MPWWVSCRHSIIDQSATKMFAINIIRNRCLVLLFDHDFKRKIMQHALDCARPIPFGRQNLDPFGNKRQVVIVAPDGVSDAASNIEVPGRYVRLLAAQCENLLTRQSEIPFGGRKLY